MTYFKKDVYSFRKSKKALVSAVVATGVFAFGLTPSASASDVEGTSESTIVMEVSPEEDVARTYLSDKADFTITRTIGTVYSEYEPEINVVDYAEDGSEKYDTKHYLFETNDSSYPEVTTESVKKRYDDGSSWGGFGGRGVIIDPLTAIEDNRSVDAENPIAYINYYKPNGQSYTEQVVYYDWRVNSSSQPLYDIVSTIKYRLSRDTYPRGLDENGDGRGAVVAAPSDEEIAALKRKELPDDDFRTSVLSIEEGDTTATAPKGYETKMRLISYHNDKHLKKTIAVIGYYKFDNPKLTGETNSNNYTLPPYNISLPLPLKSDEILYIHQRGGLFVVKREGWLTETGNLREKFSENILLKDDVLLERQYDENNWDGALSRYEAYKEKLKVQTPPTPDTSTTESTGKEEPSSSSPSSSADSGSNSATPAPDTSTTESTGKEDSPSSSPSSSADSGSNSATPAPDTSTTESTGKDDSSSSSPSSSTDSGSNSVTPAPDTSTTESTGKDDSSSSSPSSSADSGSNSATLAPDTSTTESTDKKDPSKPSVHSKGNKEEKTITGVLLTDTDAVSNKDKATRLDVKKEDKTKAFAPEANSVHTNVARDSKLLPKTGERISILSSLGILISTVSLGIVKKYRKDY